MLCVRQRFGWPKDVFCVFRVGHIGMLERAGSIVKPNG